MGFTKNIAKKIQLGLNARIKAMSTFGDTSLVSGMLNSITQVDGDSGTAADDFKLSRQSVEVKSPYVRMIGSGENTIDIITGTFNQSLDTTLKLDSVSGVQNLTGGAGSFYNTEKSEDITVSKFGNKGAGITSVTVNYLDGGSKVGATRKATIQWQCWSMEDLQRFQNLSFLSLGAGIILDFGWVRSDKALTAELEPPAFVIIEDGKAVINSEFFSTSTNEDGTKHPDPWLTLSEEKYGDWEGVVGVVTGMNWSMNDAGGFDCTTDLMTKGTNPFSNELIDDSGDNSSPLPIGNSKTGLEGANLMDFVKETYKAAAEADDLSDEEKEKLKETLASNRNQNQSALNITDRLRNLDLEILKKYYQVDEGITEDNYKGPTAVMLGNNSALALIHPYRVDPTEEELAEDAEAKATYKFNPFNDKDQRNSKLKYDMWINWGWFEDNVVSYYSDMAQTNSSDGPFFRSVIADNSAGKVRYKPVEIMNKKELVTYTSDFLLPGQTPEGWFTEYIGDIADKQQNPYKQLAIKLNKAQSFSTNEEKTKGSLRNIFVNINLIRSAFGNPGMSIDSAMLKLAKSLNRGMKIWDFEIRSIEQEAIEISPGSAGGHDGRGNVHGEGQNISQAVAKPATKVLVPAYYQIFPKTSLPGENESDEHKPSKSYIFENYGLNSLLKTLTLETQIGSKFATSMMLARKSEDSLDPIEELLGMKKSTLTQEEAKDMAIFFGSETEKGNNIWKFIEAETKPGKDSLTELGNPSSSRQTEGSEQYEAGDITEKGLTNDGWNHETQPFQDQTSINRLKKMKERFKVLSEQGTGKLDVNALLASKDKLKYDKAAAELNMLALPGPEMKVKAATNHQDEVEKKTRELNIPYLNNFNLHSKYLKTLKWYLVDNTFTSMLSSKNNDKIKQLPLEANMTLDGIGGLKIGNLFRLAYLPEIYKQTAAMVGNNDFIPGTYFTMMEVSHTIGADGWETTIKGIMQANFNEIKSTQIQLKGKSTEALKKAIEASFTKNFEKIQASFGEDEK